MASSSSSSSCSSSVLLLLLIFLLLSCIFYTTDGQADDEQNEKHMKPSWVKSVMFLTDTAFPYTSMYLEKGRVVLKKVHDFFICPMPDIDFRSSAKVVEGSEATASEADLVAASKVEKGGVGERVKEAASRSLEKSKSTLEESAKLAGDAIHEVKDKLKSSLKRHQDPPQTEL